MKQVIFLLIGILMLSVACQDNFVEPENDMTVVTKSAKFEKTKTHQIKGRISVIPDPEAPMLTCSPVGAEIKMHSRGWISGHENIFGKFDQEHSIYEKESCELNMTDEGPVVYNRTNVIVQRSNGDKMFAVNNMWINVATGDIWGYTEINDGTGRFEGVTGRADMLNASIDLETGIGSWDEIGYLTLVIK